MGNISSSNFSLIKFFFMKAPISTQSYPKVQNKIQISPRQLPDKS